jgi:hypothetical protein
VLKHATNHTQNRYAQLKKASRTNNTFGFFADTKANAEKTKSCFLQTLGQTKQIEKSNFTT